MKINGINKVIIASVSFFLATMGVIGLNRDSKMQKQISKYKTEVLDKDSLKYASINASAQDKPLQVQTEIWEYAYKEVQDSVKRVARQAHRNYIMGIEKARKHKQQIK